MYFKKLELYGFKSFAEKTVLEFEPGVTAIVGPNGCGKSNIADAIKWVLGEQSAKQLRGSAMEDVIFNGTDKTAAVNLAEVSLTLSNEGKILPVEYAEVTVTRRVFRSGESEYLLNKNPVRLKDIAELFMDTGIGSSAYSMMEQGKVDQILSSRPEDRREIFEEAAGITKYKAKKKEALRKLEQTEQNLLRVVDIITEVKRQISSVERQAQKAKKYQAEFEKLKGLELKKASFEFKNIVSQKENSLKEHGTIKEEENTFSLKVGNFTSDLDRTKQELFKLEEELSRRQDQQRLIETNINTGKNKISLNIERSDELEKRKISLENEVASFKQKISDLNNQLENLKLAAATVQEDRAAKKILLEKKENYLVELSELIKKSEDEIIKTKKDLLEVVAQESRLKNDVTKVSANIQNGSTRQRRLKLEKENVNEEIQGINAKLAACANELEEANKNYENFGKQKEELEINKNKIEEELRIVTEGVNENKDKQLGLKSKVELLEDLKSRYEGFSSGVKAILGINRPAHLSGIIEAVANLIEVNKGYELAIEAALTNHTQDVLVETKADAQRAVEYLTKNNLGQATFITLDSINNIAAAKTEQAASNLVLGPAVDFINSDEKYKNILGVILKDVFLVNNLEEALKLKPQVAGRIITLKGERVDDYSISGGSISLTEGATLIGREAKIRELKEVLFQIENNLVNLQNKQQQLKTQFTQLQSEINQVLSNLQEAQIVLTNKNSEKASIEQEKKKVSDEIIILDSELEEILGQLNQFDQTHENLNKNLSQIEQEHLSLQNLMSSNQDLIGQKSKEREEILIEITQIKTEITSLLDKSGEQQKNKDNLEHLIIDEGLALKTRQSEVEGCRLRREELLKETKELEKTINGHLEEKEGLKKEISSLSQKRNQSLGIIGEVESQIKKEEKASDELRDKIHQLEIKNNQLDFNQQTLKNKIEQAYKVNLETLPLSFEEGINWEEVDKKINELKDKLDRLGSVNLVAIEEHQELQDRSSFLTHQQEDLSQAKEQLNKAISKINKTTRQMFDQTFVKIQTEFRNFFKMLFGGGEAELVLTDEDNMLESGIDIIVRPPGKKLQSITLLSGGEKALTATALLFSFFKIKPSPFCVMDEIDAPLDESNIDRFCRVLQDFIKQSQFIIVTHNKKTITMADVMYGITMERSGISKIVSVKFSDKKTSYKEKEKVAV